MKNPGEFLDFLIGSLIFNHKHKSAALREIYRKYSVDAKTLKGNAPKASWRPFGLRLKSIGDNLGNDRKVLQTLQAMIKP
jgi:hypothetical protein